MHVLKFCHQSFHEISVQWLWNITSKLSSNRQSDLFSDKYNFVIFYLMVIAASHKNSFIFSAWLQCRFVFLAFSSCLMSFRRVQLLFCPQEQSKNWLKLITTQFSCPINSHFNSMICGCCLKIQAMEMTSLSDNSRWWKMAYVREPSEPKQTSAISHQPYNVLVSICKFSSTMRLNLQGKNSAQRMFV